MLFFRSQGIIWPKKWDDSLSNRTGSMWKVLRSLAVFREYPKLMATNKSKVWAWTWTQTIVTSSFLPISTYYFLETNRTETEYPISVASTHVRSFHQHIFVGSTSISVAKTPPLWHQAFLLARIGWWNPAVWNRFDNFDRIWKLFDTSRSHRKLKTYSRSSATMSCAFAGVPLIACSCWTEQCSWNWVAGFVCHVFCEPWSNPGVFSHKRGWSFPN